MKILTIVCFCLGATCWANAQSISPDVVASAGTHFSNGSTQLSWTIGEPVINTHDNGSNILTQGFHQPDITVTGIHETEMALEGVSVYPNPTDQLLNIRLEGQQNDVTLGLYDSAGRMVLSDELTSGSTLSQLSLTGIANGTYLLRLVTKAGLQATFNIQKIQP
ncbi:MAG: T9SS type A sorting domain-containing protein [Flavobacteriales bacterium]|jgi:hypothetical protein|nr:T9SS type A sorting domain-containing protein [Flavobacteriales bacterium]